MPREADRHMRQRQAHEAALEKFRPEIGGEAPVGRQCRGAMKVAATALLRCKDDWHPARDTNRLL